MIALGLGLGLPLALPVTIPATWLMSLSVHHDEIVNPDFLTWLRTQLDHLVTLDPWVLVIALGALVLAIPAAIIGFYLYQQWRVNYS